MGSLGASEEEIAQLPGAFAQVRGVPVKVLKSGQGFLGEPVDARAGPPPRFCRSEWEGSVGVRRGPLEGLKRCGESDGPWRPLAALGGLWRPLAAPGNLWRSLAAPAGPRRQLAGCGGRRAAPGRVWRAASKGIWRLVVHPKGRHLEIGPGTKGNLVIPQNKNW